MVISSRYKEQILIEVKGLKSNKYIEKGSYNKKNTVKWFFNNTFCNGKKFLKKNKFNYPVKGCYITTAKFTVDAEKHLEDFNSSGIKPELLDIYYDGKKLLELLTAKRLDNIKNMIIKYYIK